jgi:aminopeptidase-like protein
VAVDVARALLKKSGLRYTYKFLILPETIGSVAYLSRNEKSIPRMKGGLFLEMLGLNNPHALQLSYGEDSLLDGAFTRALQEKDPAGWTGPFATVIGNDERQFNGPGVRVPMLSLSRVRRPEDPDWPYPEYHTSRDTPALASFEKLSESRDLVLRMIDELENAEVPVNKFKGEIFCSRYGIHIDFYQDPEGNKALFDVMYHIDGKNSVAEIARKALTSTDAVRRIVELLRGKGLVELRP